MSQMNHVEAVRTVARSLSLLNQDGTLAEMDSLNAVDLVIALEDTTKVAIPAHALRSETFASVETIAAMLQSLEKPA